MPQHLQKRGRTRTLRIRGPDDLRALVGRRELVRALGTSDRRQARRRARLLRGRVLFVLNLLFGWTVFGWIGARSVEAIPLSIGFCPQCGAKLG